MESKSDNLENRKQKILEYIEINGPGLPVRIASNLQMDSILVSALLSEMLSDKKLFLSNMKVGTSPIYFMRGQEFQLIDYVKYLGNKERESFELLGKHHVVEDVRLPPPIRVALRSLKDFAFPFEYEGRLYWRFLKVSEERARELVLNRHRKVESAEIKPGFIGKLKQVVMPAPDAPSKGDFAKPKPELVQRGIQTSFQREVPQVVSRGVEIGKQQTDFIERRERSVERQVALPIPVSAPVASPVKKTKVKEKSDFVIKVISFLESKGFDVDEEIEFKKKEYLAKVRTDWKLGNVNLFVIGKDKKTVSENDLKLALQKCHEEKMPVLLISRGELKGKAEVKMKEVANLVFYERLE